MTRHLWIIVWAAAVWTGTIGRAADDDAYEALDATAVLVTVNGQPVAKGDVEFELLWRRVPRNQQPALRRPFVSELIDRLLLREFLNQRRVDVPAELVDRQVEELRRRTTAAGGDFDEIISRLGFTQATLRAHIELPLAWRLHLNRVVTDGQLQELFDERRSRFDGTRVRASQIVIAVPHDADDEQWQTAEQTLQQARREIVEGVLEFAEAARRHSTSPSRENGGDLGFFAFHGQLPESLVAVAFDLEPGEVSQPVRSPFGVHLLLSTGRIPGELSLEDVREQVLDELSDRLWDEEATRLRESADVDWKIDLELPGTTE